MPGLIPLVDATKFKAGGLPSKRIGHMNRAIEDIGEDNGLIE
jgi:hypothetical protein